MPEACGGICMDNMDSVAPHELAAPQKVSLSELAAGSRGMVVSLEGGRGFLTRLADIGLKVGSPIEVLQTSARKEGRVLVLSGGTRLAIGYGMAGKIMVASERTGPTGELTLSDLVTGDVARIVRVRGSGRNGIRQRLLDMGVTRGAKVRVERHAPLGDPIEITIKGYYLAVRLSEGRDIAVERV